METNRSRSERRNTGIRFRYGICLNDNCPKGGKNHEVQQIPARQDFVCSECGKPLRECPPPKKSSNIKIFLAIGAVIIAIAIIAIIVFSGEKDVNNQPVEIPGDTTAVVPSVDTTATVIKTEPVDTVQPIKTDTVAHVQTPKESKPVKTSGDDIRARQQTTANLSCGRYEGPISGGKPDGIGGTVFITRSHVINLKDGSGNTATVEPGDKIVNTKFKNGLLQQGQIIRTNGERKYITGLRERL